MPKYGVSRNRRRQMQSMREIRRSSLFQCPPELVEPVIEPTASTSRDILWPGEAGLPDNTMDSSTVLNDAVAALCLEVIVNHGYPAPRLCNKDPLMLISGTYTIEVFPNSKFIFMVRDGRATVHSIMSRKVAIPGFDLNNYQRCLDSWNRLIERMYNQCQIMGPEKCILIYYERLVTYTRQELERILQFLGLPWSESMLHHEEFINKTNGILLAPIERSSDQVIKPVYLDALFNWKGQVPLSVVNYVAEIAPMLAVLGYDPHDNDAITPTLPKQ